jgi:hypothetical protein
MHGVEALVRGEMDALGRQLDMNSTSIKDRIDKVASCSSRSKELVVVAEERAVGTGQEVCQTIDAWASCSNSACDGLDASQVKIVEATRRVNTEATDTVGGLVATIEKLQDKQDAVQLQWGSAKEAMEEAITSWSHQQEAAASEVREVASTNVSICDEASMLREDVLKQCSDAKQRATSWLVKDQEHSSDLESFRELHQDCWQKDREVEAKQHNVLSTLSECALAVASNVALGIPAVANLSEESNTQVAAIHAAADAQDAALATTEDSIAGLAKQSEAAGDQMAQEIIGFGQAAVDVCYSVDKNAQEVAQKAGDAVKRAMSSLEAQRMAINVADAAAEARWLELERSHSEVLKVIDTASSNVQKQSVALRTGAAIRVSEEQVEAAQQQARSELEEHRTCLGEALTAEQQYWRLGLSNDPIFAFRDEENIPEISTQNTSNIKIGGKLTDSEAVGAPRVVLRELQVGAPPSIVA